MNQKTTKTLYSDYHLLEGLLKANTGFAIVIVLQKKGVFVHEPGKKKKTNKNTWVFNHGARFFPVSPTPASAAAAASSSPRPAGIPKCAPLAAAAARLQSCTPQLNSRRGSIREKTQNSDQKCPWDILGFRQAMKRMVGLTQNHHNVYRSGLSAILPTILFMGGDEP